MVGRMIEARYDLKYEIAGHDFYTWLVMAKARGAECVVFGIDDPKTGKWPGEEVIRRFRSIIEPGPAFAGLSYRIGEGGALKMGSPHMMHLVEFMKLGGRFERLLSVRPAQSARYTVTLRREPRVPVMNSNEEAWRRFADEIGAFVIEDHSAEEMHIHAKMALYAGAEMNFGVVNGPTHLCGLSPYPVTIFKANVSAPNLAKHGVPTGSQYRWAMPGQSLVWQDDTYDNLMRWFEGARYAA
jgi:hypothetical protein